MAGVLIAASTMCRANLTLICQILENDVFLIATINSGQMKSYFTKLDLPEIRPFPFIGGPTPMSKGRPVADCFCKRELTRIRCSQTS